MGIIHYIIDGDSYESTIAEFLCGNEGDDDTCEAVASMAVGDVVLLGGGAFCEMRIERVA
jgi:hypothetical protein